MSENKLSSGTVLSAQAVVETDKAARYLKALCNHFNRKVEAVYRDDFGTVKFPFGNCTLKASDDALLIDVSAPTSEMFERVKYVVADHLVRFGSQDALQVVWEETAVTAKIKHNLSK